MNTIARAEMADLPEVLQVMNEARAWLHERGVNQWPNEFTPEKIGPYVAKADVWIVRDHSGEAIGTIRLSPEADLAFWTPGEADELAMYVSCLAIRREAAGLGALMLRWAGDYAAWLGYKSLRLDCRRDNIDLHVYYIRRGWAYLRTEVVAGRFSGALFEIRAEPDAAARDAFCPPPNPYGYLDPGTPVHVPGVGRGVVVGGYPTNDAGEDGPPPDNEITPGYDVQVDGGRVIQVERRLVKRA